MSQKIRQALGADVRAWALANDREVGARGRFSAELQKEFNDAHRGQMRYTPGNKKMIDLKVTVKSASGKVRRETKSFPETEVRTAAGSAAGKRGPLSNKALEAAAAALSVPQEA